MSWDRIIQDSDEDEPIEGDEPPPVVPQQPDPAMQLYQVPAKHTTHNADGHGSAIDESTFPQLNVNFDEFLQSQERNHAMISSSQQRREERWIPSASEGPSGSVDGPGSMMNEIGLAQRRLLDDDASSAGHQLPPTETFYAESIQSAPFPTMPSSHSYQTGHQGDSFPYYIAPNGAHVNGDQTLPADRMGIYDLNVPETTYGKTAFQEEIPQYPMQVSENQNSDVNPPQGLLQPQIQQPYPYSPHDTEPISSVASMRLGAPNTNTARTSLVSSHQSQTSAHDELALPAPPTAQPSVAVEPPPPKKKRGRPKKQPLPDNDEDDELANSRDHEFRTPGANGAIDPSDSEEASESDTPTPSKISDESDPGNLGTGVKPGTSEVKDSKKKKPKKGKTTTAPPPVSAGDDVIWIDTQPIQAEPVDTTRIQSPNPQEIPTQDANTSTLLSNPPQSPQHPTSAPTVPVQTSSTDDKPAPKKRGRKRKQPTEQPKPDTPEAEPEAQTPNSKLAVLVDNSPKSIPDVAVDPVDPVDEPIAETATPDLSAPVPQTPKADAVTPKNTGKGLDKHSPISARSGVPLRVGLSKRARIAPLLKMVRK